MRCYTFLSFHRYCQFLHPNPLLVSLPTRSLCLALQHKKLLLHSCARATYISLVYKTIYHGFLSKLPYNTIRSLRGSMTPPSLLYIPNNVLNLSCHSGFPVTMYFSRTTQPWTLVLNKPRHHEIVSFQTLVCLKLLLGMEAGFKD